jgi:hypothetical protein
MNDSFNQYDQHMYIMQNFFYDFYGLYELINVITFKMELSL